MQEEVKDVVETTSPVEEVSAPVVEEVISPVVEEVSSLPVEDGVEVTVETPKPDGYVVIDGAVVPDPTKTGVFSN